MRAVREEITPIQGGLIDEAKESSLEISRFSVSKADESTLTIRYTAEGSPPCIPDIIHTVSLLDGASLAVRKVFASMVRMAVKAATERGGDPLQVIKSSLEKLDGHTDENFIVENVTSPTLGDMVLYPESPFPSFLTSVTPGERATDKLTGLLPPAFLLDQGILTKVFQEMGADCAIVSMDIQGLGALNEVGLGDEIDEFLTKLQRLVGDHFKGNGKIWITREGGDEFLFMIPLCPEGTANEEQKREFQETLKGFSKRVREEVLVHFKDSDPKLMDAAEKIRMARLGSDSDHDALGVMLPYVSARIIPFREGMDSRELQSQFVLCRDENDKEIFDIKRSVKGGDTSPLDTMNLIRELDPTFKLKDEETKALRRLSQRSERCAVHFRNASTEKNPYVRSYHRHFARMLASIEPLISEPCFRINRAEDAKLGEFMGFSNPCRLSALVIDIEKFGKWNTLLGSLGADTKVLSDTVLASIKEYLPNSVRFRERGGRLIVASRNPFEADAVELMQKRIEEELSSLFKNALRDFNIRAAGRGEKIWEEISKDDERFEEQKRKILREIGLFGESKEGSKSKNPGSISVKGFCLETDPFSELGEFAKEVGKLERDLTKGELRFNRLY